MILEKPMGEFFFVTYTVVHNIIYFILKDNYKKY